MPEIYTSRPSATLQEKLLGVKKFFRTLQQEREYEAAERQRLAQLRKKVVARPKVKQ